MTAQPGHGPRSQGVQIALDEPRDVHVTRSGDTATVWIDGVAVGVRTRPDGGATEITVDGRRERIWVVTDRDTVFVQAFGRAWALEVVNPVEQSLRAGQGSDAAVAPMPGVLVSLAVAAGDRVDEGETLAVIESMKMQTEITAPRDGVVARVPVSVGDGFGQGDALVVLEALAAENGEDA